MCAKRVNKKHPDYPVYIEKCKALWERYQQQIDKEEAKYPDWQGLDHPANVVTRKIDKERIAKLKKLQKEYAYLFVEEE